MNPLLALVGVAGLSASALWGSGMGGAAMAALQQVLRGRWRVVQAA